MDTPSSSLRTLARRLLSLEADKIDGRGAPSDEAAQVCEKLRISLTRFAGPDGFASLLKRALALARAENPALENVKLNPDGSLDGLERLALIPDSGADAAAGIIAHLLGLLVTFIGQPLTLRLVREAWPDVSLGE